MSPPLENEQPDAAVREWQQKYNIKDGDPLLALLELFQIKFGNAQAAPKNDVPSLVEFRDSLEILNERGKQFSKQAAELIQTMRSVPSIRRQFRLFCILLVLSALLVSFAFGVLVGVFAH